MIRVVKYVGSFPSYQKVPETPKRHYAFIGRSNVGKSSLINMLTGRKAIARVSKQPGKTQMINLFDVDDTWMLVDLPGYGYAKQSKKKRQSWKIMVRNYLQHGPQLHCAFVLLDGSIDPQAIDLEFINWIGEHQVPFAIVYTKIDKIKPRKRSANLKKIRSALLESWEELPQQFVASSVTGEGQDALIEYIEALNRTSSQ